MQKTERTQRQASTTDRPIPRDNFHQGEPDPDDFGDYGKDTLWSDYVEQSLLRLPLAMNEKYCSRLRCATSGGLYQSNQIPVFDGSWVKSKSIPIGTTANPLSSTNQILSLNDEVHSTYENLANDWKKSLRHQKKTSFLSNFTSNPPDAASSTPLTDCEAPAPHDLQFY